MSKELITQDTDLTPGQLELIKATVAKGATNDELQLFLYRCKKMKLDPLKTGQIYFVKYGTSPGTIVVGLDGFRSIAQRSGKHTGTERGVVRDDKGKCIAAWCKVYRSDWAHPASEECAMVEYNTGKAMWAKMPETMLKKVAECAALRMAFPDDLGGVYGQEEMDQANKEQVVAKQERIRDIEARIAPSIKEEKEPIYAEILEKPQNRPGDYICKTGADRKGKRVKDLTRKLLEESLTHYEVENEKGKEMPNDVHEDFENIALYLNDERK